MLREIVVIDEEKCDGCGLCVPACHEGAIRIVEGKARLAGENLCDGLGACLGHCPQDAIRIEQREVAAFDEQAVQAHLGQGRGPHGQEDAGTRRRGDAVMPEREDMGREPVAGGCPSSRFLRLGSAAPAAIARSAMASTESLCAGEPCSGGGSDSELRQWPVQLRLLPGRAPMLNGASLLVAADCVPFTYADFHRQMLHGRVVAIACPKLDDPSGYVEKLAEMLRDGGVKDITVAHMEVPCCTGILRMAIEARRRSGRDIPLQDIVVSTRGDIIQQRRLPADSAA